jgi:hypothetical protein
MTDFPDWQAFPTAQSDNLFTSFAQVLTPGVHDGVMLPALSWSSLNLVLSASAGAAQVTINHFADLAGTQQIDSDTWPFNASTEIRLRTPLRGKYVRIDVNVTSAGNLTAQTWANFLSASSDRISFPVSQQNASDFSHSLAASGTALYTLGAICAGQALFYFRPRDATGKLQVNIHAVDELGNPGELIGYFGLPTTFVQQLIVVPDVIVQVEIDNTDGAGPHLYDFSLTVPPQ